MMKVGAYNERRTVQACGLLLLNGPQKVGKILSLLYLAGRISLQEVGTTISGGHLVNTRCGPQSLEPFMSAMGEPSHSFWDTYLARMGEYLHLKDDPGDDELSDAEVGWLESLRIMYQDTSDLMESMQALMEWEDPTPFKMTAISSTKLLRVLGFTEEEIRAVEALNLNCP